MSTTFKATKLSGIWGNYYTFWCLMTPPTVCYNHPEMHCLLHLVAIQFLCKNLKRRKITEKMLWEILAHSFGWFWGSRQYEWLLVLKTLWTKASHFPKYLLFKVELPFLVYLKETGTVFRDVVLRVSLLRGEISRQKYMELHPWLAFLCWEKPRVGSCLRGKMMKKMNLGFDPLRKCSPAFSCNLNRVLDPWQKLLLFHSTCGCN